MTPRLAKLRHLASDRIHSMVNELGFEVSRSGRVRPVDYRDTGCSGMAAYVDNQKRPVVVNARDSDCRNWLGVPFSPEIENHTPAILRRGFSVAESEGRAIVEAYVTAEIRRWRNRSLAEAWDIDPMRVHGSKAWSAYSHVFPWSRKNLKDREAERVRKHIDHGMANDIPVAEPDPSNGFQDYSTSVGRLKTAQYFSLRETILEAGYQRNDRKDGDICVDLLYSPGGERFFVRSGNHRLNVLAALGHPIAPVRVCGLVRRDEAPFWPQVQRGVIPLDVALEVFDRIFAGRPPKAFFDTL